MIAFIENTGARIIAFFEYVGGLFILMGQTFKLILRLKIPVYETIQQVFYLGVKSLSLTNLVAIFTGMVLALQFIVGLKRFGLELYTGQIIGLAIVRELGPVLTALMIAARVGSGIAAEIGSMTVSEQVLAIRAMGANPIQKLVVPRVLVVTLVTPLLTVIADVIGIFGGMLVTGLETGVSFRFFYDQIVRTVQFSDFISGISKTVFFGFAIGVVACYEGLNTTRGTQGVGIATTKSVVVASVVVFIADYFLTKIFFTLF